MQGDLLDRASLGAAATKVLDTWGHVDVVVHNARYIGPGHMDRFLDTPIELLEKQLDGNVLAALVLNQLLLPSMIEHGGGTVVNITSASGYADPTKPAGDGGWGMGYGISKGAFQRIAGFLAVELGDQGIRCFNVQPGLIATERIAQDMAKFGIENAGAPPEVIGAVVAWLCTERRSRRVQRPEHRGAVLLPRARPAPRLARPTRARTTTSATTAPAPSSTSSKPSSPRAKTATGVNATVLFRAG